MEEMTEEDLNQAFEKEAERWERDSYIATQKIRATYKTKYEKSGTGMRVKDLSKIMRETNDHRGLGRIIKSVNLSM